MCVADVPAQLPVIDGLEIDPVHGVDLATEQSILPGRCVGDAEQLDFVEVGTPLLPIVRVALEAHPHARFHVDQAVAAGPLTVLPKDLAFFRR